MNGATSVFGPLSAADLLPERAARPPAAAIGGLPTQAPSAGLAAERTDVDR